MKFNERNLVYYATSKSPVDKCGFLYKKGERNASYHKRWFVLKGNMLFYYDNEESKEPVGVIILEGCRVELCESTEEFAFAIRFAYAKSRAYILAADNHVTMESWVKALSRANFEYIRLVVKELQDQLAELQKGKQASNGTPGVNPTLAIDKLTLPSVQDRPSPKDNGSVPWYSTSVHVPNGCLPSREPKCEYATADFVEKTWESSQLLSSASEKNLHTDFGTDGAYAINEHDGASFSSLHELIGKEIVKLRTEWHTKAQKTTETSC